MKNQIGFLHEATEWPYPEEDVFFATEDVGKIFRKSRVAVGVKRTFVKHQSNTPVWFSEVILTYDGVTYIATKPSRRMRALSSTPKFRHLVSV